MKFGINMLLWSDSLLDDKYLPLFEKLKKMGYDGVELPIFDPQPEKYAALGKKIQAMGLELTAVAISVPDMNPISPDAANRQRAIDNLKKVLDCCQGGGIQLMVGPFYAALGQFSGAGPT